MRRSKTLKKKNIWLVSAICVSFFYILPTLKIPHRQLAARCKKWLLITISQVFHFTVHGAATLATIIGGFNVTEIYAKAPCEELLVTLPPLHCGKVRGVRWKLLDIWISFHNLPIPRLYML